VRSKTSGRAPKLHDLPSLQNCAAALRLAASKTLEVAPGIYDPGQKRSSPYPRQKPLLPESLISGFPKIVAACSRQVVQPIPVPIPGYQKGASGISMTRGLGPAYASFQRHTSITAGGLAATFDRREELFDVMRGLNSGRRHARFLTATTTATLDVRGFAFRAAVASLLISLRVHSLIGAAVRRRSSRNCSASQWRDHEAGKPHH